MIIIRLNGGMGNQMFMYAFARSIQRHTKERIFVSTFCYRHLEKEQTKRKYGLIPFLMNKNVTVLPRWIDEIFESIYQMKKAIYKYHYPAVTINDNKSFEQVTKYGLFISDDMFRYYSVHSIDAKIKFIDQLFMSWKYFDDFSKQICREFRITKKANNQNRNMVKEIKSNNSVCVHIRLGDYLSKQFKKSNYLCKEEYFIKAMDIIADEVKDPVFYIFSTSLEDISYIKNNFKFKYDVKYVELNNVDYEELRLMIACKHFIISNSSFSWWAQYLCAYEKKIVIAPSRWMNNKKHFTKDLYMDSWKIVEV